MSTVGIIPARGGSKRIPRKNINHFHGRPLIAYAISTMLESNVFDRVVVSTDDDEVASIARSFGAEVPFVRPAELSDDTTGTGAVIRHAIGRLELDNSVDEVCLAYPAAVFMTVDDLRDSLDRLRRNTEIDYVFSATTFPAPVERALKVGADGAASMIHPKHLLTRSQDLEERYHDVGQFYWGRREAWMSGIPVMTGKSLLHEIPRWRVQDIDTPDDWVRAEVLFELVSRLDS